MRRGSARRIGLLRMGLAIAGAAFAVAPAIARAQQAAPPKNTASPQPRENSAVSDLFVPPMRGTPDGRISGGTRGLHRPSPQPVADAPPSLPKPPPAPAGAPGTGPAAPAAPVRPSPGSPGAAGQ